MAGGCCGLYGVVAFAALGGILFGLDQGNWGGAIVKDGFVSAFCEGSYAECHDASQLPSGYAQFLSSGSSLLQLGAAVGALLLAPPCAARLGRRETMLAGSVVTVAGAVPQGYAVTISGFLAARFVAGVGIGMVTYALPMFVSEVAPPELRGALGCSMQLAAVTGSLLASLLNSQPWFSYSTSFMLPAMPAVVVAAGILCFPQSPRYALLRGKRLGAEGEGVEEAWQSLLALRADEDTALEELSDLKEALEEMEDEAPWSTLWSQPSIRRRVLVANLLQWLQQLTGVNAILSYGPAIFQNAGVPLSGLDCAVVTNTFNLIGTLLMMYVIDRWGRRALLLLGASSMLVCLGVAGTLALLVESAEPGKASPLLGWGVLACICVYMFSFAIAWGGVPWVYPSEIFPMEVKEKALSTSVCSQWVANFLVAYVVPQQVQVMQVSGTFLFYAVCMAVALCLVWLLVPETKGLPLEAMGVLFGAKAAEQAAAASALCSPSEVGSTALRSPLRSPMLLHAATAHGADLQPGMKLVSSACSLDSLVGLGEALRSSSKSRPPSRQPSKSSRMPACATMPELSALLMTRRRSDSEPDGRPSSRCGSLGDMSVKSMRQTELRRVQSHLMVSPNGFTSLA